MKRSVEQIVARQLGRWHVEARRRLPLDLAKPDGILTPKPHVVTLSYAYGAKGAEIATAVARALDIPVHDDDVVDYIAEAAHVHREAVETLDRHVQGRWEEFLVSLLNERNFDRGDYLKLLGRTIVALWKRGPSVLLGRGSVCIVPRANALAVRLTAPEVIRARWLVDQQQISPAEGRRQIRRMDLEQRTFHHRFFGSDVDAMEHYDLVLDVCSLGPQACATLIVDAYRLKFAHSIAPAADLPLSGPIAIAGGTAAS